MRNTIVTLTSNLLLLQYDSIRLSNNYIFMAETEQAATQKAPVASVGKVTTVQMNAPIAALKEQAAEGQEGKAQEGQQAAADQQQQQAAPAELSEEQMKAFFKSKFNIDYTPEMEWQIKEKLNYQPAVELTDEQKKAAQLAEEKEVLDLFIAGGGTAETFVAIKNVANADVKELSLQETMNEYVAAGFDKDEAEALVKERYYQTKLDDMEYDADGDETKEEFDARKAKLQKRVDFFSAKLENKASTAKTQAEQLLNNLKQVISDKKLQAQREIQDAAKVDEFLKTLPRKQTFELGKLNGQDLAPVHIDVEDADIAEIADTLKSPVKLKQFLYNEDGSFNLTNLTDALIKQKAASKIARHALLEGQTRMTKVFETTFPARSGYELGIGGAPNKNNGVKGKVAKAGGVQRV